MTMPSSLPFTDHFTSLEVARRLGLAVRSVQLMVDRGELEAWRTPGGHRRISRASVERWEARRDGRTLAPTAQPVATPVPAAAPAPRTERPNAAPAASDDRQRVLLIEDSIHFQNLVSLLVREAFPDVSLHVAGDGITGLAMYGQLQPQVLIVDILLPGIDGPTLIGSLRSQLLFARSRLIVVTSLDEAQRAPYAFALAGVPVIHKPQLVAELPILLGRALAEARQAQEQEQAA